MKKRAKISLKSREVLKKFETEVEIKNDKIYYLDNDERKTNVLFDYKDSILIRENKEFYMEYNFSNNKGIIFMKDLRKTININLNTINISKKDSIIEIIYEIDAELYEYQIVMEG